MERFVSSRHFDDCFGATLAAVIVVVIVVFGAPEWTFVPISMAGLSLLVRLHLRAERRLQRKSEP